MQSPANERKVPSGWSGFRKDLAHYCESAGGLPEKLTILAKSRGLWALGFYRFGRWVYDPSSEHSQLGRIAWKGVHLALREAVLRLTRMNLAVQAEIGERVWLGTFDSIQIGGDVRIGNDCKLFGSNTLGLAGRGKNRGMPVLGDHVTLAPGVVLVGAIQVPSGSTVGANSSAVKSTPSGPCAGNPPMPCDHSAAPIPPQHF